MRRRRFLPLLAAPLLPRQAAAATLYDDLGGQAGITRIIDGLFRRGLANPVSARHFENINVPRLKQKIVEHVCEIADGPCHRTGPSMAGAHRGLDLTDADFNRMVENLEASMDENGIGFFTQNRLLARLAPSRRDVVTR